MVFLSFLYTFHSFFPHFFLSIFFPSLLPPFLPSFLPSLLPSPLLLYFFPRFLPLSLPLLLLSMFSSFLIFFPSCPSRELYLAFVLQTPSSHFGLSFCFQLFHGQIWPYWTFLQENERKKRKERTTKKKGAEYMRAVKVIRKEQKCEYIKTPPKALSMENHPNIILVIKNDIMKPSH